MTALQTAFQKHNQPLPFKRYLLLFANNLVRLSAQLGVIFLYSRFLPVVDYGVYQTVWLYVNIVSVLTLFGLPNLILTYSVSDIYRWIRNNKLATGVYTTALVALIFSLLFLEIVNFTWQTKTLLVILIFVQNIAIIGENLAIKRGADTKVLVVNIVAATLFLASHVTILYIGYSLPLLLVCLVVLQMLKFASLCTLKFKVESRALQTQLGKQWLYMGLIDSVSVIYKWLDKWVILFFISVSQFAIYFNGSYEIPVFILMVSAIRNVLLIELSKQNNPDVKYIKHLFTNTTLLLAAIVFPAFSFLLFYHESFFLLFFGEQYVEAIPIFLVSIFILPLRITSFTALLQLKHRNDLILSGVIIDLALAVLFMLVLYPWLGLPGLALAFVLSSYLQVIFYLRKTMLVAQLKLSDFFPLKQLCILLISSLGVIGCLYFIAQLYFPNYMLLAGILTSLAFSIVMVINRRKKMLRNL